MQSSFQARAYDYRQRASRHGPPQPAMDGEQPRPAKKPKFEQDFIILSEFSEQVGPVPVVSCLLAWLGGWVEFG